MDIILIFAALKRELKYLLRDFKPQAARQSSSAAGNVKTYEALYRGKKIIFLLTGMGAENSRAAFEYALSRWQPEKIALVLSIGFCGMLRGEKQAGGLLHIRKTISYPEGEEIELPAGNPAVKPGPAEKTGAALITLSAWTKKSELRKASIAPSASGETLLACDTETFPLAKAALSKSIPFGAIRAVTDTEDEELAFTPGTTADKNGNYDLLKTLGFIASRPALIKDALRLAGNSRMAAKNLSVAVRSVLERI